MIRKHIFSIIILILPFSFINGAATNTLQTTFPSTFLQNPHFETDTSQRFCDSIFIPTAFTPNDDGINDFFGIFFNESKICLDKNTIPKLNIYDRWSAEIFSSQECRDILGLGEKGFSWEGKIKNGNLAPEGVYVYTLSFKTCTNETVTCVGNITLIR